MVHWLLTNLDKVTNEEERERSELIHLIDIRDGCKEQVKLLITDTGLAKKALTKRSAKCRRDLKKAENEGNNERVAEINIEIQNINIQRATLTKDLNSKEANFEDMLNTIDRLKDRIKVHVAKRKKTKGSLDGKLEDVSNFMYSQLF